MQTSQVAPQAPSPDPKDSSGRRALLMEKAKSLEAAFLSEMLSYAGADAAGGEFSGGIGEDQYASFLREAQARSIVDHGGIGLAEKLFKTLVKYDQASE